MKLNKLVLIALCALSTSSFAAVLANNGKGFYVGAGAGTNILTWGGYGTSGGFAWNANAGYQFNRHFALEGGFTQHYMSGIDNLNSVALLAKGIIPFGQSGFSLFGKIGPSYLISAGTASLHGGLGAAYAVTPSLEVNTQIQGDLVGKVYGDNLGVGALTAGLTYHFNKNPNKG